MASNNGVTVSPIMLSLVLTSCTEMPRVAGTCIIYLSGFNLQGEQEEASAPPLPHPQKEKRI